MHAILMPLLAVQAERPTERAPCNKLLNPSVSREDTSS